MAIKLGSTNVGSLYLGSTKIGQVYLGSTKIYESSPAPAPTGVVIGDKRYPTVTMPDGKEWLAVNLDYAWTGLSVPTSSASASTSPQAMYYSYDEATYGWNGYKCGLLYNWYAVNYMETHKSTLFPGWHVPTSTEWDALITAVGGTNNAGTKLKAEDGSVSSNWPSGWGGTDDYGFAGLPGGLFNGSTFNYIDLRANFWTATDYLDTAYFRGLGTSATIAQGNLDKFAQFSVRLVKDTASSDDDPYNVDWDD